MPRFQRLYDPNRPGQVLVQDGDPVATVVWIHDYDERARTCWFLFRLDDDGEPYSRDRPRRLAVSDDVDGLVADRRLDRAAWHAQAKMLELTTSAAALEAGEARLARMLDGAV